MRTAAPVRRLRRPALAPAPDVYYRNCDAVRAAGKAPLRRGEPGYRPGLDRDRHGVACERRR
ncbi:excalibur calcium-binding domain-containing protein [Corynebacterium sp. CCM 8836]|uniref:excalibur calcium-binding domain-containing protein n=1 Tax=Corynebacterium pygosceleis TaxID=2800406 RepID=UPI001905E8D7